MLINPYPNFEFNPVTGKVREALIGKNNLPQDFLQLAHETAARSGISGELATHFAANLATLLDTT